MISRAETVVRVAGVVLFCVAWLAGALGAALAHRRAPGRASGLAGSLRAMGSYVMVATPYFAVCIALWHPLPITPSTIARWSALATGVALGGFGAGMYLWGRATLGEMYNVSSAIGSELFAGHRLVTDGPYRIVRHPMYVGLIAAAIGALLAYRTWTSIFMVACLPGAVLKARREDHLLAEEFGEQFEIYRREVPGWLPRLHRGARAQEVAVCPGTPARR